MYRLNLAAASLAAALFLAPGAMAAPLPAQTSSAQAVSVRVTPRLLEGAVWEFEIAFDTHSGSLDDDLVKSTVLVLPNGTELTPIAWQGPAPGGHHRSGVLRFQAPSPAPEAIVLRIRRAGEAGARSFQWKLR